MTQGRHRAPTARVLVSLATLVRLSYRAFRGHAARLILTVLAIGVSVCFLCGSLALAGLMDSTVARLMSSDYEGADIVVRPGEGRAALPVDAVSRALEVDGVDRAVVLDERTVFLEQGLAEDASVRVRPWYGPDESVGPGTQLVEGTAPGPGEALVNATSATGALAPGSVILVGDGTFSYAVTVTGTWTGRADTADQVGLAVNIDDYTSRYLTVGVPTLLVAVTGDGTDGTDGTDDVTVGALTTALTSPGFGVPDVRPGAEVVAEARASTASALGFVRYLLYGFSGVALLASMFIITNTFTMSVAQRVRSLSLLRTLGVSRRQVTLLVLGEALLWGVLGSVVGVAGAVGAVTLLRGIVERGTEALPLGEDTFGMWTLLTPVAVGIVMTLVSAAAPALRAGGVSPLEGARRAGRPPASAGTRRSVAGLTGVCAGVAMWEFALLAQGRGTVMRAVVSGSGAVMVLIGVYLASPAVIGRLTTLWDRYGNRPPAVRLAALQARRDPHRAAGTAFALTLGLMLTTVTGMFGASMSRSVAGAVDSEVTADFVVSAPNGTTSVSLPGMVVRALPEVEGVGATFALGKAPAIIGAGRNAVSLVSVSDDDPRTALDLGQTRGSFDLGTGHGVLLDATFARTHGYRIGDRVELGVPGQSLTAALPVQGIYGGSRILGTMVVSSTAFWDLAPGDRALGGHRALAVAVSADDTVGTATLEERLEGVVDSAPMVSVQTPQEFAGAQTALLDRLVAIGYAMCALGVLVALLGVVNTLALSVAERRREIGMLRVIGAPRGLVRRMVTVEAVRTALYGGVLGVLTGLASGAAVLGVLGDVGLDSVVVPWRLVAGVLVGSVAVGALAALLPAVRAARVPPLEAVAEQT